MKTPCEAFEDALLAEDATALWTLSEHGKDCDACREKVLLWQKVSDEAPALRRSWESPELASRIQTALETAKPPRRSLWLPIGIAAGIVVYALAGWLSLQNPVPYEPDAGMLRGSRERLLSDETLRDVEKKEAAFVASIDALERRAVPKLESSPSPLMASTREKLVLLDSAIAECRREIARNEFNTNLRRELLTMYQEKKKTLQALVNENGDQRS